MARIAITPHLSIDDSLISESFIQASGPGGQNVNKVASAVQLRFDLARAGLPFDVHARLEALAGMRLTRDGALLIKASRYRAQQRNREDARARLMALIREAAIAPKIRHATKPTRASKERRLSNKKARSQRKQSRASIDRGG
jgi:ribosome-associated protein